MQFHYTQSAYGLQVRVILESGKLAMNSIETMTDEQFERHALESWKFWGVNWASTICCNG
jgi:hypothetical protein